MKINARYLLILCSLAVIVFSCRSSNMIHYRYADGNGNVYLIRNDSIYYEPITAANSSSGMYSGGKAATAKLSAEEKSLLEDRIKKVFKDTDRVIQQRVMTSGQLMVYEGEKQKEKIIVERSDELDDFEKWLKQLLHKS